MTTSVTKAKPKKSKSKEKGSAYERHIAKKLGSWWGETFQRTPASGGLNWGKDNRVCGDIVTPSESRFPFTVECKKREKWNMDSLFKGSTEVASWWAQVKKDCEKSGLLPMLIFSRNLQPDYVCLKADHFVTVHYWEDSDKESPDRIFIKLGGDEVIVLSLDNFIAMNRKEQVIDSAWVLIEEELGSD